MFESSVQQQQPKKPSADRTPGSVVAGAVVVALLGTVAALWYAVERHSDAAFEATQASRAATLAHYRADIDALKGLDVIEVPKMARDMRDWVLRFTPQSVQGDERVETVS